MTQRKKTDTEALLREYLLRTPLTYAEIEKVSGMSYQRARRWMLQHRGEIRIVAYGPDKRGRAFVPRFMWGKGPDAPRPGRLLTPAEAMRKTRALAKLKANPMANA